MWFASFFEFSKILLTWSTAITELLVPFDIMWGISPNIRQIKYTKCNFKINLKLLFNCKFCFLKSDQGYRKITNMLHCFFFFIWFDGVRLNSNLSWKISYSGKILSNKDNFIYSNWLKKSTYHSITILIDWYSDYIFNI